MEEEKKKTKEVEIKTKSPMWVVVLVAVLVIALACEFVYIWKLKKTTENLTNTNAKETITNGAYVEEKKEESVEVTNNTETNTTTKEVEKSKKSILDSFKGIKENSLGLYKMYYTEKSGKEKECNLRYFYSGMHVGKLMIGDTDKELKEISCEGVIKDAKTITSYNEKTDTNESTLYILFEDGTMGKISTEDIKKKNYKVTSMKEYNNVASLLETFEQFGKSINAGGYSAIFAIGEDGATKLVAEGTAQ